MDERKLDQHYTKKRVRDPSLEQYEKQIKVWDLHVKEGKTFPEITKIMDFQNRWDAKNYYNAAKENIKKGPPFGPPFTIE